MQIEFELFGCFIFKPLMNDDNDKKHTSDDIRTTCISTYFSSLKLTLALRSHETVSIPVSRRGPDHRGVVAPDRQPEGADQGSLLPGGQAQDEGAPGAAAVHR